uniref:Uncharacterized protein n=1 Tax=Avena sativa TaxID=4498 RepID=A0ACD5WRR9_AVESA
MKATARRGGCAGAGALGDLPAAKTRKKRKDGGGGFTWGCGGSKSVSVVVGKLSAATTAQENPPSSTTASAKQQQPLAAKPVAPVPREAESAPSVDALLRQLRELERGVRALGVRDLESGGGDAREACRCSSDRRTPPRRHHRRGASEVFGGSAAGISASAAGASARRGRLEEESVAVVTETEDPLGEFRRSMAEMVVENGITGGAELRELLQRFLSLNSARHHHLILLAFADVWEELFARGRRPVVPHPATKHRLSPPPDGSTSSSCAYCAEHVLY